MNNNTKVLSGVIIVLAFAMFMLIFKNILVNKVADQVVSKLMKEYSPSPYGPTIDPDKIDYEKVK